MDGYWTFHFCFHETGGILSQQRNHVSQLIADFTANEQCGEIATLHHVLVPVNWNVAVDQAHTAKVGVGEQ